MLFSKGDSDKRSDIHSRKLTKLSYELHSKDSFVMFMKGFIERACKELYQVDEFSEKNYGFSEKFVSFE